MLNFNNKKQKNSNQIIKYQSPVDLPHIRCIRDISSQFTNQDHVTECLLLLSENQNQQYYHKQYQEINAPKINNFEEVTPWNNSAMLRNELTKKNEKTNSAQLHEETAFKDSTKVNIGRGCLYKSWSKGRKKNEDTKQMWKLKKSRRNDIMLRSYDQSTYNSTFYNSKRNKKSCLQKQNQVVQQESVWNQNQQNACKQSTVSIDKKTKSKLKASNIYAELSAPSRKSRDLSFERYSQKKFKVPNFSQLGQDTFEINEQQVLKTRKYQSINGEHEMILTTSIERDKDLSNQMDLVTFALLKNQQKLKKKKNNYKNIGINTALRNNTANINKDHSMSKLLQSEQTKTGIGENNVLIQQKDERILKQQKQNGFRKTEFYNFLNSTHKKNNQFTKLKNKILQNIKKESVAQQNFNDELNRNKSNRTLCKFMKHPQLPLKKSNSKNTSMLASGQSQILNLNSSYQNSFNPITRQLFDKYRVLVTRNK